MHSGNDNVLIVDDDIDIQESLGDWFELQGFDVATASDGKEAIDIVQSKPLNLIMVDLQLPGIQGLDVLDQIKKLGVDTTVIIITAYSSIERAVEAMRAGAFDFISKPFDDDRLRVVVDKAMERERLRRDNEYLRDFVNGTAVPLVARSEGMQEIVATAQKAAQSPSTILLLGESGTGKEVFARAIHHWSPRQERPFIGVNCVALSENLLESELFGHEKGSFTGAIRQKKGKFEVANKGTILLDEIGAMKPEFQMKLLRVLQNREFERVGGLHPIRTDTRVIAATNRDLRKAITNGTFLEDLYYRLNVVSITLPPLRQRQEDIPELVDGFISKFCYEIKREISGISDAAMEQLLAYRWPGNIRELENAIERAIVLSTGDCIQSEDLPDQVRGNQASPNWATTVASVDEWLHSMIRQDRGESVRNFLDTLEEKVIRIAVEHTRGNKTQAAELLGLDRKQVERRMKKYDIAVEAD